MAESLYTVRNLKLFNALNKSIKQGIIYYEISGTGAVITE